MVFDESVADFHHLVICTLLITGVDYKTYNAGANIISYLLTPATICLAVPLYQQVELLKKNYRAVLIGILSGVLASLCSVLLLALVFHFDHAAYVTFLPKSITTAIGIGVSEELGGHVSVTVVVIIITGVIGNILQRSFSSCFVSRNLLPRVLPSVVLLTPWVQLKLWRWVLLKVQ